MSEDKKLIIETTQLINEVAKEIKNKDYVWDSVEFQDKYSNQRNKIFANLNKVVKNDVYWWHYLKNLDGKKIKSIDLEHIIGSVKFRKITFLFPIYGVPIDFELNLDKSTKILPMSSLDNFSKELLKIEEQEEWKSLEGISPSILLITTTSDEASDSIAYARCYKKARLIINLLNLCIYSKYRTLRSNIIKFDFLSSFGDNVYILDNLKSQFIVVNNIIKFNNCKMLLQNHRISMNRIGLENSFNDVVNTTKLKEFYIILSKYNEDYIILRVLSLISNSIIETNIENKFLKLISAYDALLENKDNTQGIKYQLIYNSIFVLNKELLEINDNWTKEDSWNAIKNIETTINDAYTIRSKIFHEGISIGYGDKYIKANKIYIKILNYIIRVISYLIIDKNKFKKIDLIKQVDYQHACKKYMIAYYFLSILCSMNSDYYLMIKKLKKQTKIAILKCEENNQFTEYVMFPYDQINIEKDQTFSKIIDLVVKNLKDFGICTENEFKKIKLIRNIPKINRQLIEKLFDDNIK